MADVVILGAGVAGHTAALHLSRLLPRGHTVTVVSPNSKWNWIPSNIWVGVGKMSKELGPLPRSSTLQGGQLQQAIKQFAAICAEGSSACLSPPPAPEVPSRLRKIRYTLPLGLAETWTCVLYPCRTAATTSHALIRGVYVQSSDRLYLLLTSLR